MVDTTIATVASQIQTFWGPSFDQELREKFMLASLVDRTPGGLSSIRQGDTITVSQVNQMAGELLTIGTDAEAFTPEALALQDVDVVVDKRASASLVFEDLIALQSQVSLDNPNVRDAASFAINKNINDHLYTKVAPTTTLTKASLGAAELAELKKTADIANWPEENRWLLVDPTYMEDLLTDSTVTSNDFGATDNPTIGGQIVRERYGWKIVMDNSAGLGTVSLTAGAALAFMPDWLYMIVQQEARVKISDRHSNNEYKIGFSVDTVFGAALSNDGADKHIVVKTS